MDTSSFPILTSLVLVPVAGSLLVMVTGSRRADLVKLVAWLTAIVTGALSLWLLAAFDSGEPASSSSPSTSGSSTGGSPGSSASTASPCCSWC